MSSAPIIRDFGKNRGRLFVPQILSFVSKAQRNYIVIVNKIYVIVILFFNRSRKRANEYWMTIEFDTVLLPKVVSSAPHYSVCTLRLLQRKGQT